MSMVQLALKRPYTFIVMAMLIVLATPFALLNMATDIFPEINIPGIAIPFPYGGKNRLISVDLDMQALQARGLAPADVVNAVNLQNLILPSGTVKFGDIEYAVRMNGSPEAIAGLNDLPVKTSG